jgi:hypothetical protein
MSEIAPEEHPEPPEEPPVLSEDPDVPEDLPEIPETPAPKTRAPRKKKAVVAPQPPQPPPPQLVVDANFWSELLQTRREMDRVATRTRFANLVKM